MLSTGAPGRRPAQQGTRSDSPLMDVVSDIWRSGTGQHLRWSWLCKAPQDDLHLVLPQICGGVKAATIQYSRYVCGNSLAQVVQGHPSGWSRHDNLGDVGFTEPVPLAHERG